MHDEGLRIPVCAIGGITSNDVLPLLDAGVHGIAVSGTILRADDPIAEMQQLLHLDEV